MVVSTARSTTTPSAKNTARFVRRFAGGRSWASRVLPPAPTATTATTNKASAPPVTRRPASCSAWRRERESHTRLREKLARAGFARLFEDLLRWARFQDHATVEHVHRMRGAAREPHRVR